MIASAFLEEYLTNAAGLLATFRENPSMLSMLKHQQGVMSFTDTKRTGFVELFIREPKLQKVLNDYPALIPLLKESELVGSMLQRFPELGEWLARNQAALKNNQPLQDLLAGRPRFIRPIFEADPAGQRFDTNQFSVFYDSLMTKVGEFRDRVQKGSRLPAFTIRKNSKSGFEEVDIALSDGPPVTIRDSLRSLEGVLAQAFLSYSEDRFEEGFLTRRFTYLRQDGATQKQEEQSGAEILFSPLTALSPKVFIYVLWILSGRVEVELGHLLGSVISLLEGIEQRRPKPVLLRYGHVNILQAGESADLTPDQFLIELGRCVERLFTARPLAEPTSLRATFLRDLVAEKDILFDQLRAALAEGDYLACEQLIVRCTSDQYLVNKDLVRKLVLEVRALAGGARGRYELHAEHGAIDFVRTDGDESSGNAIASLLQALCRAIYVKRSDLTRLVGRFDEDTHLRALRHFCDAYDRLEQHRTFQMQREFQAAARELPDFEGSPDRAFFDLHHPLSDFLRVILQRRYEELPIIADVLTSEDHSVLSRHLGELRALLPPWTGQSGARNQLPDVLIEQKDVGPPRLVLGAEGVHDIEEFCRCLAIQLFGVVTGWTAAGSPSLWLKKSLITHSAIDNFLAALWAGSFNSIEEIAGILSELSENFIEYLIQFKHQKKPESSLVREVHIELLVTPARDLDVLRRQRTTILWVDDAADVLWSIKILLEARGCVVLTAIDGLRGLEEFNKAKDQIDVVVSDINMPAMDGIEMTREIKRLAPQTPVILCSGLTTPNWRDSGADAFLPKPVISDDILATIMGVLARRHPDRYAAVSA